MADDKRQQSPEVESRHRILKMSGYAAAAAFCVVSVSANLQYGLSLGKTPIDKATYAAASVAADVFKMAVPMLALSVWSKRFHILAIAGLALWLGCVGWSMASAVGFVLSSRGEVIADRTAEVATRHGWEAKVERAENQLATLGKHRPVDVIKAEVIAAAVPLHIWRRSRQCVDLTVEESRLACVPVLGLRKELAAAEAAERLEAQLVAGRAQLATVSVAGSVADPQASAAARLIGVDEGTVRSGIAILLAVLIEGGSALGFTLVSVATARNPPPSTLPRQAPHQPPNAARRHGHPHRSPTTNAVQRQERTQHTEDRPAGNRAPKMCAHVCSLAVSGDIPPLRAPRSAPGLQHTGALSSRAGLFERWLETSLRADTAGSIPAREAYTHFCCWARAAGIEPCTETRFGRDFSARIIDLGGMKVKRRDRSYYQGVTLKMPIGQTSGALRVAA